jgi:hypothetical protein
MIFRLEARAIALRMVKDTSRSAGLPLMRGQAARSAITNIDIVKPR